MRNSTNLSFLPLFGKHVFSKVRLLGLIIPALLFIYTPGTMYAQQCSASIDTVANYYGANVSCFGAEDGAVRADLATSVPNQLITYYWENEFGDPIGEGKFVYDLGAGTYYVTATDVNSCSASASIILVDPAPVDVTISANSIACFGDLTTVSALVLGGTPDPGIAGGYYYSWTKDGNSFVGNTLPVLANMSAGLYAVTVIDANGCTSFDSFTLTSPPQINVSVPNYQTNVSCFGLADGAIMIQSITGGTTPYIIEWSQSGNVIATDVTSISGLTAGNYDLLVTDAEGCEESLSFTLTQPEEIVVSIQETHVSCFGFDNGELMATITPAGTYQIAWSNGETDAHITNLAPGNYSVEVVDLNTNCAAFNNSYFPGSTLPANWAFTTSGFFHTVLVESDNVILDGIGGTSTLQVGDYVGVFFYDGTTLKCGGYSQIQTNGETLNIAAWVDDTQVAGKDGFENGDLFIFRAFRPNVREFKTVASIDFNTSLPGLSAGIYTGFQSIVTELVFDENIPAAPFNEVLSSWAYSNTGSFHTIILNNNSVHLDGLLGTNKLTTGDFIGVFYMDGAVMRCGGYSEVTSPTTTNLAAWGDDFTTIQKDGFANLENFVFKVYRPASLQIFDDMTNVSYQVAPGLSDGQFVINGNSIVDELEFSTVVPPAFSGSSWDYVNTGTYHTIIINNADVLLNGIAGTQTLAVGDFIGVFYYDDNNILRSGGYAEVINPSQTVLSAWADDATTTNKDGFVSTDEFIFRVYRPFMNFFTNIVSVSYVTGPGLIDNGLFVAFGQSIIDELVFTIASPIAQLSATITEPDLLETTYTVTDLLCANDGDGAIDISVVGGTLPYDFEWTKVGDAAFSSNSQNLTGLSGGTYNLTVTDANLCVNILVINVFEPLELSVSEMISAVSCNSGTDGEILLTVTGGVTPYFYNWSLVGAPDNDVLTGLVAGDYTVTITDDNNCVIIGGPYTVLEPAALMANDVVSSFVGGFQVSCIGASDGSIELAPSGGTLPYTYVWSDGTFPIPNERTGLIAGTYEVTIIDGNSCEYIFDWTLTEPAAINVQFALESAVSCFNGSDGSVDYTISNANGTLSFSWSNGLNTGTGITGLSAGTYEFTVTDENNCSNAAGDNGVLPWSFTINTGYSHILLIPTTAQFSFGDASLEVGDYIGVFFDDAGIEKCAGYVQWNGNNVSLVAWGDDINTVGVKEGFDANEDFVWKIYRPTVGEYTATATYSSDAAFNASDEFMDNGYSGIDELSAIFDMALVNITTVVVPQPDELLASFTGDLIVCNNGTTNLGLTVTGGTTPYTYEWNDGSTDDNITVSAGNYEVTITDHNSCELILNTTLANPLAITFDLVLTDALCNGEANGTALVQNVTGGYGGYNISWSAPNNLALGAGNFTVSVTDMEGCVAEQSFDITEPDLLVITPTVSQPTCIGDSDGSISIVVTGGVLPILNYAWSTGGIIDNVSGLTAGFYGVTVEDSNGCLQSASIEVTDPTEIVISGSLSLYNGGFNLTCNNSGDGSIDLSVTGGAGGYSFDWSNGAQTPNIDNLDAGFYVVTVEDANGCLKTANFTLTEPGQITVDVVATSSYLTGSNFYNTSCNGFDGSAEVSSVTNAIGLYDYAWTGGYTGSDIIDVAAGTYYVTITDENFCEGVGTVVITGPGPVNFVADVISGYNGYEVSCYNGEDGQIEFTWDNGVGPFDIYFSDWNVNAEIGINANTEIVTGFSAGTYYAVIVDDNGCATISNDFTLSAPSEITLPNPHLFPPTCAGGNDGSINLNGITGGIEPYEVQWIYTTYPAQTGFVLNGLQAGDTYLGVISDDNGCSAVHEFTIPDVPVIVVNSVTSTDVDCYGASTGTITADVVGGSGTFEFSVDGIDYFANEVSGLAAGTYTLYIRDTYGCVHIYSPVITIDQNDEILALETIVPVSCNGFSDGSISVVNSGGITPYSYNWDGYPAATTDLTGLTAGDYFLTITDNLGCNVSFTFNVSQPSALSFTVLDDAVSCNGGNDGSALIFASGGTPSYSYLWSDGGIDALNDMLTAGTYEFTVTDDNSCTASGSVTITEPAAIAVNETILEVTCFNGSNGEIELSISGGTAPYSNFEWTLNGNPVATSQNVTGLVAGTYTVSFTDLNSCVYTDDYVVAEPDAINIIGVASNISCNNANDGSILITSVTGGDSSYDYEWSLTAGTFTAITPDITGLEAGEYLLTVNDGNSCIGSALFNVVNPDALSINLDAMTPANCTAPDGELTIFVGGGTGTVDILWETGATTTSVTGLLAGDYDVTITDANNCTLTQTFTVGQVNNLSATALASDVNCFGGNDGQIVVTVLTGNGPFDFTYNTVLGSQIETGLIAGTYDVLVTDSYGCQAEILGVEVFEPTAALSAIVTTIDESCYQVADGEAFVLASGGTSGYTYSWDDGLTFITADNLTNIVPGSYSVIVKDMNECEVTVPYQILAATELMVSFNITNASCDNSFDGNIEVVPSGGNSANYYYSWDVFPANMNPVNGVSAGVYNVSVYDANFCLATGVANVDYDFGFYFISSSVSDVNCNDGNDGSITVSYNDVTPNGEHYTFVWFDLSNTVLLYDENASVSTLQNLVAGSYILEVRAEPANGCVEIHNFTVQEPDPIVITPILDLPSCYKFDNGSISLDVTGGSSIYTYTWSKGANYVTPVNPDGSISNINAGIYRVTVADALAPTCNEIQIVTLGQPAPITSSISAVDVTCFDDDNGSVTLNATGGTGLYTYEWNLSALNTNFLTDLSEGNYEVTITDANGCEAENDVFVNEPALLQITNIDVVDALCFGDNGNITPTVVGGNFPYSFVWSPNTNYNPVISTNDFVQAVADDYYLKVIDSKGCETTTTATIEEPAALQLTLSQTVYSAAPGGSTAFVSVSGGTAAYSYFWSSGSPLATAPFLNAGNTYNVTVTDANLCQETGSILILSVASPIMPNDNEWVVDNNMLTTDLINEKIEANVYPNPSRDGNFNLFFNASDVEQLTIEVYDALGKVVKSEIISASNGGIYTLSIPAAKGVYHLRILTQEFGSITKQLIITE